ncbi:RNA polymerase sigma factor [Geodermatophilus ruber]|uniref:RNA polymerase sigma-70 factor, ECF subfamily n=1 Tax=Geodermatophilus ruber TaxID=504800 RepID=A0A1I4FJG5_9ACTN|nr:sigma-70 family RNA polymerase sigma factor [Geodermatophilus ruber]SFL17450.1 RNA polymerase sigma-70 factor, ECF subfamily [Geodermatophilus ruber]
MSRPARRPGGSSGDIDLALRLRTGDRAALDELYDRFSRPALALARRVVGDDALAEAVLQEAFLSAWREPGAFGRGRGSVAAWLLATVHRHAVDAVRREEPHRRRQTRAGDELALAAGAAEHPPTALDFLPPGERAVLALAYYGGYTQREVAALTGVPIDAVRTRMLTGMRALKEELGQHAGAATGGALGEAARADGAGR